MRKFDTRPLKDLIASMGSEQNAIKMRAEQPPDYEAIARIKLGKAKPTAIEILQVYAAAHRDITNTGTRQIEESPHQVRHQDVGGNGERQGLRRLTLNSNEIDGDNRLPNFLLPSSTEERKESPARPGRLKFDL